MVSSWETPLLSLLLDNQLFEEKTSHKLRSPGWSNDNPITVSSTTTTNYVDHTLELGRPGPHDFIFRGNLTTCWVAIALRF